MQDVEDEEARAVCLLGGDADAAAAGGGVLVACVDAQDGRCAAAGERICFGGVAGGGEVLGCGACGIYVMDETVRGIVPGEVVEVIEECGSGIYGVE